MTAALLCRSRVTNATTMRTIEIVIQLLSEVSIIAGMVLVLSMAIVLPITETCSPRDRMQAKDIPCFRKRQDEGTAQFRLRCALSICINSYAG